MGNKRWNVIFKSPESEEPENIFLHDLKTKLDPIDYEINRVEVIGSAKVMLRSYISRLIISFLMAWCIVIGLGLVSVTKLSYKYYGQGTTNRSNLWHMVYEEFDSEYLKNIILISFLVLLISTVSNCLHYFSFRLTGSRTFFWDTVKTVVICLIFLIVPCLFSYVLHQFKYSLLVSYPVTVGVLLWLKYVSKAIDHKIFPDFDKSRNYLLIKFNSGKWWYFELKESVLQVIKDYSPEGIEEQIIRSDDSIKSVVAFIDWLHLQDIPENVATLPPTWFVQKSFDYLAKEKCYNRIDNFFQSPSTGVKGNKWSEKFLFINAMNEKMFLDSGTGFKSIMKDEIVTDISVYKHPLNSIKMSLLNFFHAYVVIRTTNMKMETWWSIDKHTDYIIVQKNAEMQKVKDILGGDKRCEGSFQSIPELVKEIVLDSNKSLEIIVNLFDIENPYHWVFDNCQHLAKKVFDKFTGQYLYYGFIHKICFSVVIQVIKLKYNLQVMVPYFKVSFIGYSIQFQDKIAEFLCVLLFIDLLIYNVAL